MIKIKKKKKSGGSWIDGSALDLTKNQDNVKAMEGGPSRTPKGGTSRFCTGRHASNQRGKKTRPKLYLRN